MITGDIQSVKIILKDQTSRVFDDLENFRSLRVTAYLVFDSSDNSLNFLFSEFFFRIKNNDLIEDSYKNEISLPDARLIN